MLGSLLVQYNPDGSLVYSSPYLDSQIIAGRQPFSYVEIDLDFCANTAGVAPCTATQTGDDKCYNTFASCNDIPNFSLTTKTYRFCSPNGGKVPRGLDAIPCLKSIAITPAELTAGKGLGLRADCTITMQDFPHSDIRVDPYVNERTYIPVNRGTYFGKLKARNPFYNGRVMRVYNGYLNADGSFSAENFERRTYVIEQWDAVDTNGVTRISAKDILKLADDERAVCPRPSIGKLTLDLSDSATSFNVTPSGVGSDYPASGYVRIGSEILSFTRSGDAFTVVRARKNSTAESHSQGDVVQLCHEFVAQTAQNISYELFTEFAYVDPSYIVKSEWDAEQATYLPRLYGTLITAPTGVKKLLTGLTEEVGFLQYWDEVASLIRFQTIRPNSPSETVHPLTYQSNLLADSLKTRDLVDERVNEVWVYYGVIDWTKNLDEDTNYRNLYIATNPDDQGQLRNRDVRIKKILSRWTSDQAAAIELGQRYLERFAQAPIEAEFMLDAKDANIGMAEFVTVESKQHQAFDGSPMAILLQVVKRVERQTGTTWAFVARQFAFSTNLNPVRIIYIDGSVPEELFDLNLKSAHDARFAPAVAGTVVQFIINPGVLVSASTTASYALTNPNTWAAGVIVRLINGGVIAGRGGNGGTGGDYSVYGGVSPMAGADGGVAFLADYPISIDNSAGIISGGSGGGGGGGAARITGGVFGEAVANGGGGGGGWPLAAGGSAGDAGITGVPADDGDGAGSSAGGSGGGGGSDTDTVGSLGILYADGGDGGVGGGQYAQDGSAGTDGSTHYDDYDFPTPPTGTYQTGAAGGAAGDAVHGNSNITWLGMGSIYGDVA